MRAVVSKQADGHTNKMARLIDKAPRDVRVGINSPIAQKRPVGALGFDAREIGFRDDNVFFVGQAFPDNLSRGIADKTLAPKFDSRPPLGRLVSDAVRNDHIAAIGDRMPALHGLP